MTKRDYVAIASVVLDELKSGGDRSTLESMVKGLCDVFQRDNPKFSRETFAKASGFERTPVGLSRGVPSKKTNTQPFFLGNQIGSL